jgi:hypothetical protein
VRQRPEDERRERAGQRYAGRCGYCSVAEEDAGAALTVDHHRPRTRGGGDQDENIVYCCPKCNEYKGSYWHESDPPYVPLLHPLRQDLQMHIIELEDGHIDGLTPEGTFFVRRLHLNRPQLVTYRLHRRAESKLREEADALRARVSDLQQRISELDTALEQATRAIEREGLQEG